MSEPSPGATSLEASFAANQKLWDAWTAVHAEGEFYDVAGFRDESRVFHIGFGATVLPWGRRATPK